MSATDVSTSLVVELRRRLEQATENFTKPAVLEDVDARGLVPTLPELDHALRFGNLKYPFALMYKQGRQDPPSAFTEERATGAQRQSGYLDYRRALHLLQQGHSMELGAIEYWHPRCSQSAAELALHFGARVDAQAFLTPPGRQGLATHRDRTHVLAIQIEGAKRWRVHDRPLHDNWTSGNAEDPGPLALEHVMRPGQALYFPAGCAHTVIAEQQALSAHVTFGLHTLSRRNAQAALNKDILEAAADVDARGQILSPDQAEADVLTKIEALLSRPDYAHDLVTRMGAHRAVQSSVLPPQEATGWWKSDFFQAVPG
jgi:lysine-specific demethylase/histidyl-hydroxylase NO66